MKRDFLKELGLTDEQINSVMQENGKDIEREKGKFADYEDLKNNLQKANETLEKFKDYEQTKADVEKYKAELAKAQDESNKKIARMELESKVKDFSNTKKFVNEETKQFYFNKLIEELEKDTSKGNSIDNIFNELVKDKTNIFVEDGKPTPPIVSNMRDNGKETISVIDKARAIMGLKPTEKE